MPLSRRLHRLVTARTDPRPLGVVRAFLGLGLFFNFAEFGLWLYVWTFSPTMLRLSYSDGFLPFSGEAYLPFMLLWFGAIVAFLLGLFTRAAGTVLVLLLGYILLLDQQLFSNHTYLLFTFALLLTIADSGAAFSLDAMRGRGKPSVPEWPAVLLKATLTVVYTFAILAKLHPLFLSGFTYEKGLLQDSLVPFPADWRTPGFMSAMAVFTVVFETFVVTGLWSRRLRPAAFVLGLALHATIPLIMPVTLITVLAFSAIGIAILSPYLLFLDAKPASRLVVWDDGCSFCRRWIALFRALDWLGVHRFAGSGDRAAYAGTGITQPESDEALQLVGPDGRVSGFDAVRAILEVLPVSFLWAPILRLPPIRRFGARVYRRVADRRNCTVPGVYETTFPRQTDGEQEPSEAASTQ